MSNVNDPTAAGNMLAYGGRDEAAWQKWADGLLLTTHKRFLEFCENASREDFRSLFIQQAWRSVRTQVHIIAMMALSTISMPTRGSWYHALMCDCLVREAMQLTNYVVSKNRMTVKLPSSPVADADLLAYITELANQAPDKIQRLHEYAKDEAQMDSTRFTYQVPEFTAEVSGRSIELMTEVWQSVMPGLFVEIITPGIHMAELNLDDRKGLANMLMNLEVLRTDMLEEGNETLLRNLGIGSAHQPTVGNA